MWISLKIIGRMVDISDVTPEAIAERLTMSTAEIEGIEYLNSFFKDIYTAKLVSVEPHPDADKLTLCFADTGKEKVQVVCGAPNHKAGDIVAFATVGTKFNEEFVIKKTKIRGVESNGMFCSLRELGLSDDHSGIHIFPENTPIGKPLSEMFIDWVDVRLNIDNKSITHRPDLWGHIGFAREIAALMGKEFKKPVDSSILSKIAGKDNLKVSIKNPEAAPRYSAMVIKNIKIGESPDWLKSSVSSLGMRPISNIVDITNYVMAEIGEPMHAFDRKKLKGDVITVRFAAKDEKITTLDGRSHNLTMEDIVIADAGGPIALAGVMGGGNSEVEDSTTEIVLEAATFNPVNIRKTAQRFDSRTEAAMRFEKTLSPEITVDALARCYELIKEIIPGAEAVTGLVDDYPVPAKKSVIDITTEYIRRRIGQNLDDNDIIKTLTALQFEVKSEKGNLHITAPFFRSTKDITMKDDIVEEVGRVLGYSNINPAPPFVKCVPPVKNLFRSFERDVKNILTGQFCMTEVSGYSFTSEDMLNSLKINEGKELRLRNPLSIELDRLRRSLIPNIINFIKYNQRFHDNFDIFELGRVYFKDDRESADLVSENFRVAGTVFMKKPETPVFFEAKAIAAGLLEKLRIKKYKLIPATDSLPPYAHPGRSMKIEVEGKDAGLIFEVHPETAQTFEFTGKAAIFDLDLDVLFNAEKNPVKFTELQKYPEVPFEISVVADKKTYSQDILNIVLKSDRNRITEAKVISVYEGAQLPGDKKSVSIKIVFASKEKTLEPSEIDELQKKVISSLNKDGYTLR
ncbi:MAG TPA: phenylalanine--tRNA ligase subunit beta [Spirochaetota bacterium]|nr:phenylalanine--tRNA ligase subunit beta [Spirochaetota bacterium]HPS86507.1 phenylalanine--tRNA ligase subunit beta [Spirochaetota bacterium]